MIFTQQELLYIIPFYLLGAILGFFAFRYRYKAPKCETIGSCILTAGIGTFLAVILAVYLEEEKIFSHHTNMLLGGVGMFPGSVNKFREKRALEMLDSMKPLDEVESMLMLQMALTHDFILDSLDERTMPLEKSHKDLPTATKLMRLFTNQVLALNKYRAYNGPALTFNSVVADNAIVGDVHNAN